jgi:hypothetical protein
LSVPSLDHVAKQSGYRSCDRLGIMAKFRRGGFDPTIALH